METNASGIFDAVALPPGIWSMRISKTGFKVEARNGVELQVDQVARMDFTMQVGNVTETVEVAGAPPVLDTETATGHGGGDPTNRRTSVERTQLPAACLFNPRHNPVRPG